MNDEWLLVAVGTAAVLAALLWAGAGDLAEAEMQQAHYCELVALHKRTGGRHGWPDFENNADEVCGGE